MRRRVPLTSLSPLALTGLAGLAALMLSSEMTARLATQLGQSTLDTGWGATSYLGRTVSLSTALLAAPAWAATGGFCTFVAHRGLSDTRTTAEHTFALTASVTVPFVTIFTRDRLAVTTGVNVALLVGVGIVFAGRSNARGVVTGSLYAVASVVGGGVITSPVTGPTVARTATLAPLPTVGYALDVANARSRLRLGAAVSTLAFAVPARTYLPPVAEAAGFNPETVGLALDFAVAVALLLPPFAAIGCMITRAADAERQAGASPAASAVEQ